MQIWTFLESGGAPVLIMAKFGTLERKGLVYSVASER